MSNACYAGMRIGRTEETAVGRSNACSAGMRIGRTGSEAVRRDAKPHLSEIVRIVFRVPEPSCAKC